MNIRTDLDQNPKKSKITTYLGILFILLVVLSGIVDGLGDWKLLLLQMIIGILTILNGLGLTIPGLGKKYIEIDESYLTIKMSLFKKPQRFNFESVQIIELLPGGIILTLKNGKTHNFNLAETEPEIRHNALITVKRFAELNQIHHVKHGYLQQF